MWKGLISDMKASGPRLVTALGQAGAAATRAEPPCPPVTAGPGTRLRPELCPLLQGAEGQKPGFGYGGRAADYRAGHKGLKGQDAQSTLSKIFKLVMYLPVPGHAGQVGGCPASPLLCIRPLSETEPGPGPRGLADQVGTGGHSWAGGSVGADSPAGHHWLPGTEDQVRGGVGWTR